VRRAGESSRPFYAPANYLKEDGVKPKLQHKSQRHADGERSATMSRGVGGGGGVGVAKNADFRRQRSTSMDAIMFLELLENEIKEAPSASAASAASASASKPRPAAKAADDKFKKPRISKNLWDRRKSWAVEDASTAPASSASLAAAAAAAAAAASSSSPPSSAASMKLAARYQNHQVSFFVPLYVFFVSILKYVITVDGSFNQILLDS